MYIASPGHLPSIQYLHDYWLQCRGSRSMPRRADICPTDIPLLLSKILLVDLEHAPFRVRYRVVGTSAVEIHGRDFTGLYLDEVKFNKPDELLILYRRAADEKVPTYRSGTWHLPNGITRILETGIFPLSDDDDHVTQCLAIEDFRHFSDSAYMRWRLD